MVPSGMSRLGCWWTTYMGISIMSCGPITTFGTQVGELSGSSDIGAWSFHFDTLRWHLGPLTWSELGLGYNFFVSFKIFQRWNE